MSDLNNDDYSRVVLLHEERRALHTDHLICGCQKGSNTVLASQPYQLWIDYRSGLLPNYFKGFVIMITTIRDVLWRDGYGERGRTGLGQHITGQVTVTTPWRHFRGVLLDVCLRSAGFCLECVVVRLCVGVRGCVCVCVCVFVGVKWNKVD